MKTKLKTRFTQEHMLTVRISKQLLKLLNTVSNKTAMSRSDYIRSVLEKSLDSNPLSYTLPKTK
ncbi:hypothetical protein UFOVP157_42 [uncultured Caudovirales phage]|uniref:Uncharacterized protein n=1 Tax=uncultured Caudovirales phage TaxID=2100421 RepID=A0A6J7W9R7_9CAUD|nr:hypothetical protein UFOVP157_42 [uncultured Caudovirales phage]